MSAKEQSDLRQGISFLFPRVQILNRVTLFKILLINLKTAFLRIQLNFLKNDPRSIYHSRPADWRSESDNSCCGFTR